MSGIARIRRADVCTCQHCTDKRNRIAAFGAIRRAAEVAREQDAIVGVAQSSEAQGFHRYAALPTRRAIRAAIGSDNA